MRPRRLSATAPLVILLLGDPAIATPVQLRYDADPGCPSRKTFVDSLRERIRRVRRAQQNSWQISVRLLAAEGGYHGLLRIGGPDGTSTSREVSATECTEVASALSLIVALAIESVENGGAAQESITPVAPDWHRDAPESELIRSSQPPWSAGIYGVSMAGPAPNPLRGFGLTAGYEPTAHAVEGRFRLSADWLLPDRFIADGDEAELAYLGLRLESCPVRLADRTVALLAPCLSLGAGRLAASGRFEGGEDVSLLWADVGGGAHLELALSGAFHLDMQAAVIAPLTSRKLVFENPRATLHETPSCSWLASAGIGVRFP